MSDLKALSQQVAALQQSNIEIIDGANNLWILISGVLVFFMQVGFAMLENGSLSSKKHTESVLFKNVVDGVISALSFWLLGYGLAFGDSVHGFCGKTRFALTGEDYDIDDPQADKLAFANFFFQWAFAATAATIVSGALAERCKVQAYFVYSAFITAFVYPVVAHWVWGGGWLSPFGDDRSEYLFNGRESNNFIDFAGSGVVHTVGGSFAFVGAWMIGPRKNRFAEGNKFEPVSQETMVLGAFILWVGWYGFNAGSTGCIVGDCTQLASKVAVVTTISAAASGSTMLVYQLLFASRFDMPKFLNSILAGLVSVTGPCAVVEPWAAFMIGIIGCAVYMCASRLLELMHIDDAVDASAVHGFCGIWGVLAVGIFGTDNNAAFAGYAGSAGGSHPFGSGEQFAVQVVGILCILAWSLFWAALMFALLEASPLGLRDDDQDQGNVPIHLQFMDAGRMRRSAAAKSLEFKRPMSIGSIDGVDDVDVYYNGSAQIEHTKDGADEKDEAPSERASELTE